MIKDRLNVIDGAASGVGKSLFDSMKAKGHIKFELFDVNGNLKLVKEIDNTVSAAGKNMIAEQLLASPTIAKPGWMELGTGTPGATKLGAYITGSRTAFTSKTRANNVVTMVTTFAAGVGTGAITEAGVFNVETEDTADMILYTDFGVITKAATDSLTITWTLTIN